jgi:hypothetical protein
MDTSFSRRLRSVYVFVTDFVLYPLEPLPAQFVRSEVVFLEVPSLSIQHWNHSREHKNYKEFIEQEKKLQLQLDQLNIKIRELNTSDNRSTRFMLDLWRGSKGHNKKSVTKTYTDLNLLEKDGQ